MVLKFITVGFKPWMRFIIQIGIYILFISSGQFKTSFGYLHAFVCICNFSFYWNLYNAHERIGILLPKLFWHVVRKNCSSDREKHLNFKSFSQSLEHFFLTLCQNNFGNKIPINERKKNCLFDKNHNFICILTLILRK